MRRICVFCRKWSSGGIESFLCNMLSRMDLRDLEIDLVALRLDESVFTKPLREKGIRFVELSGSTGRFLENTRRFRALLRERRYDVLHVNAYHALSLFLLHEAKRRGVPTRIAHSHNSDLRPGPLRWLKLLTHRASRALFTRDATALWACSEPAARFLFSRRALEERGYSFVPNGIELGRFAYDAARRGACRLELGLEGKLVIGNVGRLSVQKNQGFLLDVFAALAEERPESVLLLVGGDEGAGRGLRGYARALGVAERTAFTGGSDRVGDLLQAMDVFVFPSRFEGLGIAAVEAQAAGLPVLCSQAVPAEAAVTEDVVLLDTAEGAARWAEEIVRLAAPERHAARPTAGWGRYDRDRVAAGIGARYRADGRESGK